MSTVVFTILCLFVGSLILKVVKNGLHVVLCVIVGMVILKIIASHL